jgi:assimilatory nitrate reductase catalytic subunit
LTGQGNGQGGREHGQKSDQLPGYRRLDNPRHRAEVAAIWGVDPAELPKPGLSACELLDSVGAAGGIEGLFVMGSNVVVSAPAAVPLVHRLANLGFSSSPTCSSPRPPRSPMLSCPPPNGPKRKGR